jgi:hypothetical protein
VEEKRRAEEVERRRRYKAKARGKRLLEKRKRKFVKERMKKKKEEDARKEEVERAWMETAEWDDTGGVGAMSVAEAEVAWDVVCGVVDFEL